MYTIGQVSEMFDLPVSTLRYYDKEGLLPNIQRSSGIRKFSDKEIEALRVIECLKKSGMEIKDIKKFMEWSEMGSVTYPERKELFVKQKEAVESEINKLEKVLSMLKYKCWYYDQAIKDGNEHQIFAMLPDKLPEKIQEYYNHAHETE
ncbi:MAG: MerR family transcriptional regulator [Sedimentibacter sp.]|uniref:MerR family transcriptional regulator n=1 Tax=Sedimentibacter sp. TaxID=1960295 RepID=UPI003158E8CD